MRGPLAIRLRLAAPDRSSIALLVLLRLIQARVSLTVGYLYSTPRPLIHAASMHFVSNSGRHQSAVVLTVGDVVTII